MTENAGRVSEGTDNKLMIDLAIDVFNAVDNGFREGDKDTMRKAVQLLSAALQKVRLETLEEAAKIIDQCNHEGPYNAIQGASRIRALAAQQGAKS